MARPQMVTRTIISTLATIMIVSIADGETYTETVEIPRTFKDEKKLLEACKKEVETDDIKVVAVVNTSINKQTYGMYESDFLKNAVVLDDKRKPIKPETVEDVNEVPETPTEN